MKMEDEQSPKLLSTIGQLSRQGAEHHQNDKLDEAVDCYREAYELAREVHDDKTERTCAFNLGAAYIANGDSREGLNYLHKAIPPEHLQDERSNGDLYFNMGLGHEKMQNEDKALEEFRRANDEYAKYERDKAELQILCLEKCFQIYQKRKDFLCAADMCKLMADVFSGSDESSKLSKAERLCERATQLRFTSEKKMVKTAAEECENALNDIRPKGDDCIIAGKILNDLGLVFTQILEYDEATNCFEKAVELVHKSHRENQQLEAVVLQNLGAAYNFNGDYQRAVKFHEDAADKYALIGYRNGQGQCFTNLAFALSQLRDLKSAEIAFHHALQASKDTKDSHMKWQALEGLGAVSFNQGNTNDAVDFFIEALKTVGENKTASDRIKVKMLCAINTRGSKHTMAPYRSQDQMMYSNNFTRERTYMSTHGPAEEHHQLSATPRSPIVHESPIVPRQAVPVMVEPPIMAVVQDSPPKRRMIPMRKKDSIGPHMPKISRGLGSLTYDSPRIQSQRREVMLQEESSSSDDSSSGTSSSSDTSSGEDEADIARQPPIVSQKVDQIFARPTTSQMSLVPEEKHVSMYAAKLEAQEAEEESDSEDSSDNSSDDDSDGDSDDEATDAGMDDPTYVNQPLSPPPLPSQSPPNTTQVSTKHLGTYLTPYPQLTPDACTVHAVADVHEPSDSSRRVAEQPPQTAESPRGKSSSDSDEEEEDDEEEDDDNNKKDDKDPYATIDTATKSRQPVNGQDEEDPYHTLKFEREGPTGEAGEGSAMKIDQLPRGQREVVLAHYHQEHQSKSQEPPPLPDRSEEKSSKTCVIM